MVKALVIVGIAMLVFSTLVSAQQSPTRITLWSHLDRPDLPYIYDLIEEFNDTHPHIEVEFELVPWGAARDKYITAILAGNPADVIFFATPLWASEFWEMGALAPLDEYIADWEGRDDIFDSAWEASRVAPDEAVFGLPAFALPAYMYYRRDWYEELGLDVPETREEFLANAIAITESAPDRYGYGMRGARGGHGMWGSFVLAANPEGEEWFDADGNVNLNSPEAVEANQWYVDLFQEHGVVPPSAPQDGFSEIIQGFSSGRTGHLIHHIMSAGTMIDALGEDSVGVMKIPSVNDRRWAELGLHHWVITEASEHKDEAFEFASWLASAYAVEIWSQGYGTIPLVSSVAELPYYQENPFMRVSIEIAEFASMPPYIDTMGRWSEQIWPATFQQNLMGQMSSEEALEILARELIP